MFFCVTDTAAALGCAVCWEEREGGEAVAMETRWASGPPKGSQHLWKLLSSHYASAGKK